MKPQEPGSDPFTTDLLRVLQSAPSSMGLTPGQLRAAVSGRTGTRRDLRDVRAACHELWLQNEVVIEPPGRDKKEYRVWHAAKRPGPAPADPTERAPRRAVPGRSAREGAQSAEEHFRVTLCGQLAGEWSRAGSQETREVLRRLLTNFGAERVEFPEEILPFKGRRHECDRPVLPGASVRVTEPGWMLRFGVGEYLLIKARVVPA